jgi:hypothetical protein
LSRINNEIFLKKYNAQFIETPAYFNEKDLTYVTDDYISNEENLKYFKLVTKSLRMESNTYHYCDTFDFMYNLYYTIKKYDSLLTQIYDSTKINHALLDLSKLQKLNNPSAKLNLRLDHLIGLLKDIKIKNQLAIQIIPDTVVFVDKDSLQKDTVVVLEKKPKSKKKTTPIEPLEKKSEVITKPVAKVSIEDQYKSLISEINRDVFYKRYKKFLLDSPAYFTEKDLSSNTKESAKNQENLKYLDLVTTSIRVDSAICVYCDKFSTLLKLYETAKLYSSLLYQKFDAKNVSSAINDLRGLKRLEENNSKLNLRIDFLINKLSAYSKMNELTKFGLIEVKKMPIKQDKLEKKFEEKSTIKRAELTDYPYLQDRVTQFIQTNKASYNLEDF